MTTGVNRLTERAGSGRTTTSAQLRAFVDALGRLGFDRETLLAALGLTLRDLDDPDAWIACEALQELVTTAMRQRYVPNIGARMAAATPIGTHALLDYLVLTCDTVGEGGRQLAKYFPLSGAPAEMILHEDEDPVRVEVRSTDRFTVEFCVALMVLYLRQETEGRLRVAYVSLAHMPEDVDALAALLGCTVRAPSTWCGVALPKETWALPMRRRDPMLKRMLESHAREMTPREVPADDSTASRVRGVLSGMLGRGEPSISIVARRLNVSARTLQRRLAVEGVSFQHVVDMTRREIAERLLSEASLTIAEISYLLGFSEPSAFHRAFKRWMGVAPLEFRRAESRE